MQSSNDTKCRKAVLFWEFKAKDLRFILLVMCAIFCGYVTENYCVYYGQSLMYIQHIKPCRTQNNLIIVGLVPSNSLSFWLKQFSSTQLSMIIVNQKVCPFDVTIHSQPHKYTCLCMMKVMPFCNTLKFASFGNRAKMIKFGILCSLKHRK